MNKIQIETLTPVHIGSGNMLQNNTDFVVQGSGDDRYIYIVDDRKILDLIGEEHLDNWLASIERKESTIDLVQRFAPKASIRDYTTERITCYAKVEANDALKEIIHDGRGKPYIPGSSIKGAIRTAVLSEIIALQNHEQIKEIQEKVVIKSGNHQKVSAVGVEKQFFGDSPNADIFRFVRVGDAYFEDDCIIASRMINLNIRKGKNELKDKSKPQLIEAIGPKERSIFEMKIDTDYYDLAKKKYSKLGKLPEPMQSLTSLFASINNHTKKLVESEIAYWQGIQQTGSEDYIESMEIILDEINEIKNQDACVLRIGHASGWCFITGAWTKYLDNFEDVINAARPNNQRYQEYDFPKTRRIDEDSDIYGFVKLTLE
ncbi:MAG: RAMP superfamily protein [Bacteroidetes bacterium ADurb.BinA261]|jgi:CRISPR type III-A-associated RAMP protein Csm5|nr:MAG: RAMP superfamily protein [Bacteroidetes bacterium ADurb.BinA261]